MRSAASGLIKASRAWKLNANHDHANRASVHQQGGVMPAVGLTSTDVLNAVKRSDDTVTWQNRDSWRSRAAWMFLSSSQNKTYRRTSTATTQLARRTQSEGPIYPNFAVNIQAKLIDTHTHTSSTYYLLQVNSGSHYPCGCVFMYARSAINTHTCTCTILLHFLRPSPFYRVCVVWGGWGRPFLHTSLSMKLRLLCGFTRS